MWKYVAAVLLVFALLWLARPIEGVAGGKRPIAYAGKFESSEDCHKKFDTIEHGEVAWSTAGGCWATDVPGDIKLVPTMGDRFRGWATNAYSNASTRAATFSNTLARRAGAESAGKSDAKSDEKFSTNPYIGTFDSVIDPLSHFAGGPDVAVGTQWRGYMNASTEPPSPY